MGSARDFFSASMADALLPAFRRPFEDVIYETLDTRQVPTRTDFKELRDQINSLRGQLTGATGGVKKLADEMEALQDRLAAVESKLAESGAPSSESLAEALRAAFADAEAKAIDRLPAEVATAVDAGLDRLADALTEKVATRLGARLDRLEAHLSEAWLTARLIRVKEDILAELNPRINARPELSTVDLRLAQLRDALHAEIDDLAVAHAPHDDHAESATQGEPAAHAEQHATGEETHCRVEGCPEPRRSKGFCARHYQQWRRGRLPGFPAED